ncbi:MAG TPA: sigma-70 family RNA polymerase sigma factor [Steroidobacteraceae bacterium]|nr:sigma-70 family RNA polymerase sigma factor [Steroidobacteraceae bacterium]
MGDERSRFEAQVLPHLDAAYRFALALTRAPDDAADLVQEAILRAFRGFQGLKATEAKPWLLTIVRNCYFTARERQRRETALPLRDDCDEIPEDSLVAAGPDPERSSIQEEQQRALGRLLPRLPREQREALILREIEDMSYRDIAAVTRVPIGTVMSRLARARVALKELWIAEHGAADR